MFQEELVNAYNALAKYFHLNTIHKTECRYRGEVYVDHEVFIKNKHIIIKEKKMYPYEKSDTSIKIQEYQYPSFNHWLHKHQDNYYDIVFMTKKRAQEKMQHFWGKHDDHDPIIVRINTEKNEEIYIHNIPGTIFFSEKYLQKNKKYSHTLTNWKNIFFFPKKKFKILIDYHNQYEEYVYQEHEKIIREIDNTIASYGLNQKFGLDTVAASDDPPPKPIPIDYKKVKKYTRRQAWKHIFWPLKYSGLTLQKWAIPLSWIVLAIMWLTEQKNSTILGFYHWLIAFWIMVLINLVHIFEIQHRYYYKRTTIHGLLHAENIPLLKTSQKYALAFLFTATAYLFSIRFSLPLWIENVTLALSSLLLLLHTLLSFKGK